MGVLLGLFDAGLEPPAALVGCSVGALNAATIAAFPSLAGAQMLREIWLSDLAREALHVHPVGLVLARLRGQLAVLPGDPVRRLIERSVAMTGIDSFEHLRRPLQVVATDIRSGRRRIFASGQLAPALLASTAIPGVFPSVRIDGIDYLDGGIVDNTPISVAAAAGAREVLVISLMAPSEMAAAPASWDQLIARTIQLSLHNRLLADFERHQERLRLVVICPVSGPASAWDMRREHVLPLIEKSREATVKLLNERGSRLFKRSGLHYLELGE